MRLAQLLVYVFAFPSFVFASHDIEKTVLDNGLTVLVRPLPSSGVVSIYAYVKAGSATEDKFMGKGISHFVEHMLFKGTDKRPVGAIAKEIQSLGGNINASTTLDYTMVTLDVPKGEFQRGLDILSDMLMNSVFDPAQVEKEREVIHGEMRLYNDRPDRRLSRDVLRNVYIRHPYRHPIIGYLPLFDSITREELYAYYRSRYIPNNIILSVTGAVDLNETMSSIKTAFKDFRPLVYPERAISPEPPQISQRYYEEYYQTPLFRFSLAFQGVALTDPDLYALDVLAMALGQGEGSRLYEIIYKKKNLVHQISSSNFTPLDKGILEIEGVMDKDNLSQVLAAVKDIAGDIKRRGLSSEELAKTKRRCLSQFVFGNQTSSNLAYRAAMDEAASGDPEFSRHYVQAVKNVTNEDIKRVAKMYLVDSALSITILKPIAGNGRGLHLAGNGRDRSL
ncbi:MAG: insulinase family protein, partial [Candidatus Omnitrophica bacterium]|nr:insulinase family protein [Candidatus Omnitrophota bacterium]